MSDIPDPNDRTPGPEQPPLTPAQQPPTPSQPPAPPRPPKPQPNALWEMVQTLLVTLVVALLLRYFVVQVNQILGASMQPTLYTNERVITFRAIYYLRAPRRGEVVVLANPFRAEGGKDEFIKRVIAVAGDTIEVKHGQVYLNGQKLSEPYINHSTDDFGPVTVPPKSVFVMGDNRPNSVDSRRFGVVADKNVDGRAVLLFWPFDHWRVL